MSKDDRYKHLRNVQLDSDHETNDIDIHNNRILSETISELSSHSDSTDGQKPIASYNPIVLTLEYQRNMIQLMQSLLSSSKES